MTVLVTGAAGYLGRHVVAELAGRQTQTVAVCRNARADFPDGVSVAFCDLGDEPALRSIFEAHKPRAVVHCAALIPRDGTAQEEERARLVNVEATKTLLKVMGEFGAGRIVFASSVSVYTARPLHAGECYRETDQVSPEGFYGEHKVIGEELCRAWCEAAAGRSGVALRYAGLHGAGRRSGAIYAFLCRAMKNEPLSLSAPQSCYAFLNVKDAARATVAALDRPTDQEFGVFNIAGAESLTLRALADKAVAVTGSQSLLEEGDAPTRIAVMSIDAARHDLGFEPTPIDAWLADEFQLLSQEA